VAFAYLSWVLLFPLTLPHAHSIMLIIAGVILTVAWLKGVFRFLADPEKALSLMMGLFFMAEAVGWLQYQHQAHPPRLFVLGVYFIHIALLSLYHYIRCYQYPLNRGNLWRVHVRGESSHRTILTSKTQGTVALIILHLIVFYFGYDYINQVALFRDSSIAFFSWIIDPSNFTVWVVVHLILSDLYPHYKRWMASGEVSS
ncbi:MAG: hypothetical protein ACKO34_00075, partial [Vampirovibrionales bacterium]